MPLGDVGRTWRLSLIRSAQPSSSLRRYSLPPVWGSTRLGTLLRLGLGGGGESALGVRPLVLAGWAMLVAGSRLGQVTGATAIVASLATLALWMQAWIEIVRTT